MPLWLGVTCVGARFAVQQASLTLNRIHGESSVLQRAPARPCFSGRAPKSEQTVRISVQLSGGGAALSSAIAAVDSMGYWHGCLAEYRQVPKKQRHTATGTRSNRNAHRLRLRWNPP